MPIKNDSLNKSLYSLLKTQGFDPQPKDSTGKATPVPDDADVFKFTFHGKQMNEEGETKDTPAWATIENGQLKVYYDDGNMDQGGEFTNFLKQLKRWGQRRQLGFEPENENHLASDMAQREHMKKKENIAEGYYPMGKSASYNDSVPTVKIVLQHTRQIQEGEQRFRNIARIYLENVQGERILAPTNRPGIAQVYARHLAEGGVPNDERWNHIKSLCEEYSKMAGFVRAVRGNQFNESAQRLVEAGLNHYTSLRESLGKMRGHRGYNAYFESWTPTLMETEGDETNLNELFVQETLDPRIESVMPILNRLKVDLSEMKEVNELAEWADSLTEAPGAETLAHNQATEKSRLDAFDLDEAEADDVHKKINTPAVQRKASGAPDWKVTGQDLEKAKERNISGKEGLAALTKRLQDIGQLEEEDVAEGSDYQEPKLGTIKANLMNTTTPTVQVQVFKHNTLRGDNYWVTKEVRKFKTMNLAKAYIDRINKQGVAEDLDANQKRVGQLGPTEKVGKKGAVGKLVGANESMELNEMDKSQPSSDRGGESSGDPYAKGGKATPITAKKAKRDFFGTLQKSVDKYNKAKQDTDKKVSQHMKEGQDDLEALLRLIK